MHRSSLFVGGEFDTQMQRSEIIPENPENPYAAERLDQSTISERTKNKQDKAFLVISISGVLIFTIGLIAGAVFRFVLLCQACIWTSLVLFAIAFFVLVVRALCRISR